MKNNYNFLTQMIKQDYNFNIQKDQLLRAQAEHATVGVILSYSDNTNPYMKQKKEEIKLIHEKYAMGTYMYKNDYNVLSIITNKVKKLGNDTTDTINKLLKNVVNKISGRTEDKSYGYDWKLDTKIRNKDGLYDKKNILETHLKKYEDKLVDYSKAIYCSTSMKQADQLAYDLESYHNKYFPSLCSEADNVLQEFEVQITGYSEE